MKYLIFIFISLFVFQSKGQVDWDDFEKGVEFQKQEKYDSAIVVYTSMLKDSMIYGCLYNRAVSYHKIEEYEKSLIDIRKANNMFETDSSLYLIGLNLGSLSRYQKAIDYFKKAKDKGYSDIHDFNYMVGTCYYFINKIDSAKKYLLNAYISDSRDEFLLTNLGFTYESIDPKKSCQFFKEAYLLNDTSSVNVNNLGYSFYLCGSLDSAYKYFEMAKKLDPENSYVYRNLGLLYLEKENKKLSCKNYSLAIEKNFIEYYGEAAIRVLQEYCDE